MLAGALLAITPDLDFFFEWVLNLSTHWHRGFMHSIPFAAALGLLTSVSIGARHSQEKAVLILAAASHGIMDAFGTVSRYGGVELLWPFFSFRFYFGLFDYPDFNISPRNYPLAVFFTEMIKMSLLETLIFLPLFLLLLWVIRKTGHTLYGSHKN
jgi:membrane-bound metal-dependent hydrolase YbcI (DUF457 family)